MRAFELGVVTALGVGLALGGCAPDEPDTELDGTETEATDRTEERLDVDFSEWDLDTDVRLSIDEFRAWWDENAPDFGDEDARREAVSERVHAAWDTDDDERISEEEWREGTGSRDDDTEWGRWDDWDGDGDSELDLNEVREGLDRRGAWRDDVGLGTGGDGEMNR